MSDYKDRFDKWQREAKEKFEEIDKQLGLKEKIGEGALAPSRTPLRKALSGSRPRLSAPGSVNMPQKLPKRP
jgi:hypothetical protein